MHSKRYDRQILLPEIGDIGQQKLQDARVLVIGAGGLGCPVLQNLAGAGVGTIGVVDGDVVDESNLHRQLLYTQNDCGKAKAQTAAEAILAHNPGLKVQVYNAFFSAYNATEIIRDYQIIVDCTDTNAVRYLINDVAVAQRIPVVYGSIHKFEGQLSVFNYKNGPSYRCLFPESESLKALPTCAEAGVLGVLPNTIGALQANEVLKIILGIGTVLSGKLMLYDGLHFQNQIIDFAKNPKAVEKGFINGSLILNRKKNQEHLNLQEFLKKSNEPAVLVVDLREENTDPMFESKNAVLVPVYSFATYAKELEKNQELVLFCQTGKKSGAALNYLKKEGFVKVSHLEKGIEHLLNEL